MQIACPQPTQALQAPLNKELTSARELSSGGSRGSGGSGGTNAQEDTSGRCQYCFKEVEKRFKVKAKDKITGKEEDFWICKDCLKDGGSSD